jgi:hypothetical protein
MWTMFGANAARSFLNLRVQAQAEVIFFASRNWDGGNADEIAGRLERRRVGRRE